MPDIERCPTTMEDVDTCSCGDCTEECDFFQPDEDY